MASNVSSRSAMADNSTDNGRMGDSYDDSGSESVGVSAAACPWQSRMFHDDECSRFFDCPSHQIARHLSDDEEEEEEEDDEEEYEDDDSDGYNSPHNYAERREISSQSDNDDDSDDEDDEIQSGGHEHSLPERAAQSPIYAALQSPSPTTQPAIQTTHTPPRDSRMSSPRDSPESSLRQHDTSPTTQPRNLNVEALSPPAMVPTFSLQPPLPPLPNPASRPRPPGIQTRRDAEGRRRQPEIVLPRWQPDNEVTLCPICNTQFSIFVRKHHCRKCGRVVCNSCSPHRITIPHQYIVRNPATLPPRGWDYPSGAGEHFVDAGGERVRLCNPCVPDPNTTPPQPQQFSPRYHGRSISSLAGHLSPTSGRYRGLASPDSFSRSRSSTMNTPQSPSRPPTVQHQATAPLSPPPRMYPVYQAFFGGSHRSVSSSHRALPPDPPQLAEEDECPVCHGELPPKSLPDWEAQREQHITACITTHSAYGGAAAAGSPDGCAVATRRTGMFPYLATENDCVDSAECTICLEEFQVGDAMARLECLCRFHRSCIQAWFTKHPGRCPVHQHDGFGF